MSHALILAVTLLAAEAPAAAAPRGYLRFPAITHDRIAFTAEDDLWWVPLAGGEARRLTHAPGIETLPRWSPDGNLLAYTSTADGNQEVYVLARDGGTPRRLTLHPSQDQVVGWTPDGDVIFRSRRDAAHGEWRCHVVPADGGASRPLPVDLAALADVADDGDHVAFTRFLLEFRTWKRYLGGWQQDLWHGRLSTGEIRQVTTYPGMDSSPMFWRDRIAFLSDRDGTANVWSMRADGGDLRQHGRHDDFDVRWPDLHGDTVAYMHAGDLCVLDLVSGVSRRLDITLPTDSASSRERVTDPKEFLTAFALSPDGTRAAVAARGELASLPLVEGRTITLTRDQGSAHDRLPAWSPDGRRIAWVSDAGGEHALWVGGADGAGARRLTTPTTAYLFHPTWSPDGRLIAVASSDLDLRVADAETGAWRDVDRGEVGEIREHAWSPDGRWLAYAKPVATDSAAIFLWDARGGGTRAITTTWSHSYSPAWDPKGRWLYFLSDRTVNPVIGGVDFQAVLTEMTRPYALVLAKGDSGPFFPRDEATRPDRDEKDGDAGKDAPRGGKRSKSALPVVRIDFEGLQERVVPFPVDAGNRQSLAAAGDFVLWLEQPTRGLLEDDDFGEGATFHGRLVAYPVEVELPEKREERVLAEKVGAFDVTADGQRVAWWTEEGLSWRKGLDKPGGDDETHAVDLAPWHLAVDRRAEWRQVFDEAWRLQREFYWDADMSGVDWTAARARYEELLPRVLTRDELNDLIGQLFGELSTGHAYVWGGDLDGPKPVTIGMLGGRLEPDRRCDCHRFVKVFEGAGWEERSSSPLRLPQAGVDEGDWLLAVNGRRVHADEDPLAALVGQADHLVALTVNDRPTEKGARTIEVLARPNDDRLRYLDWVKERRERVDALSQGRIGYVHVPDMGGLGLSEFMSTFFAQLEKEALVVDVRHNAGGFVSQLILERLRRVLWAQDRPRRGRSYTVPYRVFTGPMVTLCNQTTGSDGDIFAESFQILGLGKVVGTRTWGGVVGIRADKPFQDGGMSTQPEFAWWEPRRGWGLENEGVQPDVVLDNQPSDVLAGRDPQLEKGVEILLAELAKAPERPKPGPSPDKSKKAFQERQAPWRTRP